LFFTSKAPREFSTLYPEVLFLDCTYKTNRFNLPLLNMIRTTPFKLSFEIGFCFLAKETQHDYIFGLKALRSVFDTFNIAHPGVVLTDNEEALMMALSEAFFLTKNLHCIWHINKNILVKCRKIFPVQNMQSAERQNLGRTVSGTAGNHPDHDLIVFHTWKEFIQRVKVVFFTTSTSEMFDHEWEKLKADFASFPEACQYVDQQWITVSSPCR
jgi:hypothetical protein